VKGEKSDYIKKEDEQLIASQFSNSEILTIANAGHWVHAEQPAALLNLINYFFN
jgi:pimeloyl-ACP methyl ester carboxylesterase